MYLRTEDRYVLFLFTFSLFSKSLLPYEMIMSLDVDKWPIFSLLDAEFLSSVQIACVFGSSGNEALIITNEDEVYVLGSNCSGCLGIGNKFLFH